jgi:hypothetical protein
MTKKFCVLITSMALLSIGGAEEPTILKGYGKTQWGQPLAEVQEILPGGNVEGEEGSPQAYILEGSEPMVGAKCRFINDQLFAVSVHFQLPNRPETGPDPEGYRMIEEKINAKYFKTKENKHLLSVAGVEIRVVGKSDNDGKITVHYTNVTRYREARAEVDDAKREKAEEAKKAMLESERYKDLNKVEGINEAL